jgi:DNA primase
VTKEQLADYEKAVAPYIKEARDTYPSARARFLAGLPSGEHFFAVTRLSDSQAHHEQIFIRVQTIKDGLVTGVISLR